MPENKYCIKINIMPEYGTNIVVTNAIHSFLPSLLQINFDVVIGCDTMVYVDGKMVGKPRDEADAFNILKSLDGRKHSVRTGVCLINFGGDREELLSVESQVEFGQIGERLIRQYIATGEPMWVGYLESWT
jgi:predicted house-cleaning NTP pyrophosphatase (Maf/HAM1 superfamily)